MSATDESNRTINSSSETKGRFKVKNVKPNGDSQDLIIQSVKSDIHGNGVTGSDIKHAAVLTGVVSSASAVKLAKPADAGAPAVISNQNQKVSAYPISSTPFSTLSQPQNAAPATSTAQAGQHVVQIGLCEKENNLTTISTGNVAVSQSPRSAAATAQPPQVVVSAPKKSRFTVKTIPVVEDEIDAHKDSNQQCYAGPHVSNLNHSSFNTESPANMLQRLEHLFEMNAQMLARVLEVTKAAADSSAAPYIGERHAAEKPQQPQFYEVRNSPPQQVVTVSSNPPLPPMDGPSVRPGGQAGGGAVSSGGNNTGSASIVQGAAVKRPTSAGSDRGASTAPVLTTQQQQPQQQQQQQQRTQYVGQVQAQTQSNGSDSSTFSTMPPPLPTSNTSNQRPTLQCSSTPTITGGVGASNIVQTISVASGNMSSSVTASSTGSSAVTSVNSSVNNSGLGTPVTSQISMSSPVLPVSFPGVAPVPVPVSSSNAFIAMGNSEKDKASAFGKLFHYMNEMKKELEIAQRQRREGQLETLRLREKCQQLDDRLAVEHSKSAGMEERLERAKITHRSLRSQVEAQAAQIAVLLDAHAQAVLESQSYTHTHSQSLSQQVNQANSSDHPHRSDDTCVTHSYASHTALQGNMERDRSTG